MSPQESQNDELYESQELEYLLPVRVLALKIQGHWKKHAPKMYARLASAGQLRSLSLSEAEATHRYYDGLRRSGSDPISAWSQAMREKALALNV